MKNGGIEILWEDEAVLVVGKPSGMLVHRGWGDDRDVALTRARDTIGARVYPVHRLDRGTSGALLFARSSSVAAVLCRAFEEGEVKKIYRALVRGVPPKEGLIDHPIPRGEDGPRVAARTRFSLVAASPLERCALVEARPETGRLHQVRRHLKHATHPLIGDVNYGKGDLNRYYRARYGLHRLALHALALEFTHPTSGARVSVRAPMPADLAEPLALLGLDGPTADSADGAR